MKAIFRILGCLLIAEPISGPVPKTTFTVPGGKPASLIKAASFKADKGVSSLGFNTTVQPAASAGASFQDVSTKGKFQGTIKPTTPMGWRKVKLTASKPMLS